MEDQGQGPGRGLLAHVAVQPEGRSLHRPGLTQDALPQGLPELLVKGRPGGGGRFRRQRGGAVGLGRGALHLPPEGEQPGGQGLVAVKAPDASGEEGGKDGTGPLVGDGGTPVEQIGPLPPEEAQDGLPGDAALGHPAVRELAAPALPAQAVHPLAQGLQDLRGLGAELGKGDAHGKPSSGRRIGRRPFPTVFPEFLNFRGLLEKSIKKGDAAA